MSVMLTHSGRMVDLLNVTADDIDLDDIAHALSQTCRFMGHTKRPYSVAEHSINVARLLPEPIKIYGLLHDALEAYIGDISTPSKRALKRAVDEDFVGYGGEEGDFSFLAILRSIERKIERAICAKLGVPLPGTDIRGAVRYADRTMLLMEMRQLFDKPPPVGLFGVDETLPMPTWSFEDVQPIYGWKHAFIAEVQHWTVR